MSFVHACDDNCRAFHRHLYVLRCDNHNALLVVRAGMMLQKSGLLRLAVLLNDRGLARLSDDGSFCFAMPSKESSSNQCGKIG